MTRQDTLERLALRIHALPCAHPIRVAVDGVDAAGKTTLADELEPALVSLGRPVIRASIDGFHRPRADRYRRGVDSPEGYYADSFDVAALRAVLLDPLGPGGDRWFRRAIFDVRADAPMESVDELAPADAVLVFDGVFLMRPELDDQWDYRVFVAVPFEVALARAQVRDHAIFGSAEAVRERYQRRYIPGQRLYLEAVQPVERADAVVENRDPTGPALIFNDRSKE